MTKTILPKISVVTPSYNQGEFLEETIQSVLNQEYPNLEYIILDGGSTDNSVDIIKKYEKYLTYWVSEKDKGQTDAINKGFRKATGDILAWLNSDDFYCPDALYAVAQAYQRYPEAGFYSGNGYLVDKDGKNPKRYASGAGFDFQSLLKGSCYILQPATLINRKAFEQAGYLDETLRYGMDLEYWLRISKTFDVVSIDAPLANYRWHEAVKTNEGFRRWVELLEIYRRYTDKEITPGLLVEFFSILKKQFVLDDLEMDVKKLAEAGFTSTYAMMQKALNLSDCIPANRGIVFKPVKIEKTAVAEKKVGAPSVVHHAGSKPKIDFVLQATGAHAWGVGGGWANAAHKMGILNRVFSPKGIWSTQEIKDDDGLWSYLGNPQADMIMLLGFDWHSQMLHSSPKWQERWRNAKITKVLYVQESIENNCRLFDNDLMKQSFITASKCSDTIVYTDITDAEYVKKTNKPALWQPFGVDDFVFNIRKEFRQRIARPFFRGQMKPHFTNKTYAQRRELLEFLASKKTVDLLEYKEGKVTPEEIAEDFNNYQIALNLPSLFSNHPSRVYEALGCGCAVLTNLTSLPQVDNLFEDRKHLIYYSNKEELLESIRLLSTDREFSERLAKAGYEYTLEKFTLDKHILQIIQWLNTTDQPVESRKKERMEELVRVTTAKHTVKSAGSAEADKEKKIIIDGVVFYLFQDRPLGICRLWSSLLAELSHTPLAERILLLDRTATAPFIPGIKRRTIKAYDDIHFEDDSLYLENICREENAGIFLSTYYTYPENSHSILTLYDMIPELTGMDLSLAVWRAKAKTIEKASAYFSISRSTMNDFRKIYPQYHNRKICLTYSAVSDEFRTHTAEEISDFMRRYGIEKPYFILIGHRALYKNAIQFFRAFSLLENKSDYEILCTGGAKELEKLFLPYIKGTKCRVVFLNNMDLSIAYGGAVALMFPSQYEGFGLPILEAMRSGCPVITCRNSSIPEVAGSAAIYVDEHDVAGMKEAIIKIQRPDIRSDYINKGFENAKRFSWKNTRSQFEAGLKEILRDVASVPLNQTDPINTIGRLFYILSKRPDREKLLSAMKQVQKMHMSGEGQKFEKLLEFEDVISNMNTDVLDLLKQAVAGPDECDAFLLHWYGLALEQRQSFEEALDAYVSIVNRSDSPESLRGIATYLASDIAHRLGKLELARDLTQKYLLIQPTFIEGQKRLQEIDKKLKLKTVEHPKPETKREPARTEAPESIRRADQTSKIKVSAIVSTYNSERFIHGCLEDLVDQTLYKKGELEIVVVDSGSEQNERAIVKEFQQRYGNIVYTRTEERETVYAAWNRGIKSASGKYVTNANTDDRHRADALEVLSGKLDENPGVHLVYANSYLSSVPNQTFEQNPKDRICRYPEYLAPASLLHFQFGPQPMWRKEIHTALGYFDESYSAVGDYDFNLRFALHFEALHIPEALGAYLKHGDAISFRDNTASKEIVRIADAYKKPNVIEKLYRKAGIACDTPAEKAKVFLDLGIRALEFYPPWNENRPESDLAFAVQCFKWAAELNPKWAAPYHNLAIAMYLSGAKDEAINLLKEASNKTDDSTASQNLQHLFQAMTRQANPADLGLMYTDIPLPSQQELYGKTATASKKPMQQALPPHKLSILFVVHKPPADIIAGTEIYTYTLARALRQRGHTVRVLYPHFDNTQIEGSVTEYVHEGLPVAQLNLHQIPDMTYRFKNEQAAADFGKYLSGLDIDLVHFHNLFGISASALQACSQLGIPTVITMHDEWLLCEQVHYLRADGSFCEKGPETVDKCVRCFTERNPEQSSQEHIHRLFEIFSLRRQFLQDALKWINTLIVPTAFLKESLCENGFVHPNILIVPFGLHSFKPLAHEPRKGLLRFTYLGNINFTKGLDVLIQALNLIDDANVHLDVYGGIQDLPYFQQTMTRIPKNHVVNYHGPYKIKDLPAVLAKTDIAVVPSRSESYSFVVRECLQAGVPVIASRVGGIPEVVKDGENGSLFTPNDYKDLADKLRLFIRNPEQIAAFRKNIQPMRSIAEDAGQLENIYRETAPVKSKPRELKVSSEIINERLFSIIIVTYNSSSTIRTCLDSVLQHTPGAEVIVVDNASADETQSVLTEYGGCITKILNTENKGFSFACNQGIRMSKGEYVILLNPDTVVTPMWAEHMRAHFKPGVGAVGPLSNYVAALQKHVMYCREAVPEDITIDDLAKKLYDWNSGQGIRTKLLVGFCMAFPRSVLNEAGLLDENLILGNDDLDISWRLRQLGYKLIIATDAFVYHKGQVSFKTKDKESAGLLDESNRLFYEKLKSHYGPDNIPSPMELWGIDFFNPPGAHFRSFKPTFAALYIVHNETTWLKESFESVYDNCDAVYFLVSEKPWFGETTESHSALDLIKALPDPENKIRIESGLWQIEADKRNRGMELIRKAGFTFAFIVDTDEIYDPAQLGRMKSFIADHPEIDCWHISMYTYWKSYRYRIDPPESLDPPVFAKADGTHFTHIRDVDADSHGFLPPNIGICHHMSYAISDEAVFRKITLGSHAPEVKPGWFENVWKRWDADHSLTNLHPTHPAAYRRAIEQPYSALPPVLRKIYVNDLNTKGDRMADLTSIIILAHNQWDHTELCLQSIERHTPEPHEIIIVDNGSTDETRERLRALVKGEGLKVILNNTNRGFAAGNNQGLSIAQGNCVLLLNNDTIVTPGWLGRMKDVFRRYPETGVVGPMSNNVTRPQLVETSAYEGITDIDDFAVRWTGEHEGQSFSTSKASGFCLLAKRDVIDKIGGLDEQFGSGNFEDDDFCSRAFLSGFEIRIAQDVFIHHTGRQTFKGAGIDYNAKMIHNWELYKTKWNIPKDTEMEHYWVHSGLPEDVSPFFPLPDLSSDHTADPENRWWEDIRKKEEQGKSDLRTKKKERVKGLTSIIIFISEEREYARKCVESIRNNTDSPHEIIFVPFDPSYAPSKWLSKLIKANKNYRLAAPPPPPASGSDTALSYSEAYNNGIAQSKGEYIAILQHTCQVTAGWLTGMLECFSTPDTAIIGPMSVNAEGLQGIPGNDYDPEHLDAFAGAFMEKNRYRRVKTRRLESFCVLFRQALTEEIGLFDESFETNDYAVNDFCARAAVEGHANVIAGDVFVHCDGRIPMPDLHDRIIFSKKWGDVDGSKPGSKKIYCTNAIFISDELNQKGQREKAAVTLIDAIKLYPDEKRLHYALAEILIEDKKYSEAVRALESMPQGFQKDAARSELMGNCKVYLGLNEEADQYADEILLPDPASAKGWNLKGTVLFQKGSYADAEKSFQKAIDSDRSFGEAYANIGALRWASGKREDALRLFEKAFVLSPVAEDIVTNYYAAAVNLSKLPEAEKIFREAIALHRFSRRLKFILIDNLLQQGKYQEAMTSMEEAMAAFGADDDTLTLALKLRDNVGAVGAGLKPAPTGTLGPSDPRTLSVCMIVKNEEDNIMTAIQSIKPVAHEIIVVDTGSSDRTKKIARAFGAKVYDFNWTDSFSDARNFSLSKASGDWVLVLDADEVISSLDHERLRGLISDSSLIRHPSSFPAFSFVTRNYVGPMSANWHPNDGVYKEEAGSGWFPSAKVRLFPNDKRIRFEKPVHETVEDSLPGIGMKISNSGIPIHHYGKLNKDKIHAKGEEYYQLGRKKLSEKGELDPQAIYELAVQATELEKYDEALEFWERLITVKPGLAKAHYGMANSYYNLGRYREARATYKKAAELDPESKDSLVMYATCELLTGNAGKAVSVLEEVFRKEPEYPLALLALTAACFCADRKTEGLAYLKKARKTRFDLAPYFKDISTILISVKRYDYAISLLDAALETGNETDETRALLQKCRKSQEDSRGGPEQKHPDPVLLSLCMIVKDEEENIEHSLKSLKPMVDEMIVVDTGSTDKTKDIARSLGAKVYDLKWTNSFSDARNFSLSKAAGKWILVLDADEVISPLDHDRLRGLIAESSSFILHPSSFAFSFVTRTYVEQLNTVGWVGNDGQYKDEEAGTGWFPGEKVRLFPNDSRFRFEFPLHERIEPSLIKAGIEIRKCDIPVHHYGNFVDKRKADFRAAQNYELGEKKIAERGEQNFMAYYELAIQGAELGKHEESVAYLKKVIALKPDFSKAYQSMGNAHYNLRKYGEALSYYRKAFELKPESRDARDTMLMYATCEMLTGNAEKTISLIETFVRNDMSFPQAVLLLAEANYCLGKKEKGARMAQKLKEINFDAPQSFMQFSGILGSAGKLRYAVSLLEGSMKTGFATAEMPALLAEFRKKMADAKQRK
jgi:glycosyltransferase involved in cell wall biosynthesis